MREGDTNRLINFTPDGDTNAQEIQPNVFKSHTPGHPIFLSPSWDM